MRFPRDVSGRQLVRLLERHGYEVVRQSGSHIRLTHAGNPQHHLTVPDHDPVKIATAQGIISDAAKHLGVSRDDLATELLQL